MDYKVYFDRCLELAAIASNNGDIPVGAVIVKEGKIIAEAYNRKFKDNIATYHAEMLCIKEASKKLGTWRLHGCSMYVTLEPCSMCYAALSESRIDSVYYILPSTYKETQKNNSDKLLINKIDYECDYSSMLSDFFKEKR